MLFGNSRTFKIIPIKYSYDSTERRHFLNLIKEDIMLNDNQLKEELESCPAERVTPEYMKSRIKTTTFTKLNETVTICSIKLDNGFSVRGESACVKVENYNQEIGERISYDNAFDKLWGFFGFLLAENGTLLKDLEA